METVSEGETHRYVGVGNALVSVYWGAPPIEALHARVGWIERTIASHGRVGLFVVVTEDASGHLPDREFRAVSKAQADRFREHLVFSASVIEGSGVQHTLVRTFLRGLSVVAGRSIQVRFFEGVGPGAQWASEQLAPNGPPAMKIIEAVEASRP